MGPEAVEAALKAALRARAIVVGLSHRATPADVAQARSGLAMELDAIGWLLGDGDLAAHAVEAYEAARGATPAGSDPGREGLPFA